MENLNRIIEGLSKVWDAFDHMEHELYADYVFDALKLLKEQDEKIEDLKNTIQHIFEGRNIITGGAESNVVRCRECKHCARSVITANQQEFEMHECRLRHKTNQDEDWYCADGERWLN